MKVAIQGGVNGIIKQTNFEKSKRMKIRLKIWLILIFTYTHTAIVEAGRLSLSLVIFPAN